MEYSNLFVVLMGIGTVFFGLICLIVLVWVMGKLFRNVDGAGSTAAPVPQTESRRIPSNSGELGCHIRCHSRGAGDRRVRVSHRIR